MKNYFTLRSSIPLLADASEFSKSATYSLTGASILTGVAGAWCCIVREKFIEIIKVTFYNDTIGKMRQIKGKGERAEERKRVGE